MQSVTKLLPHEIIKLLRNGEQIPCSKCQTGTLKPIGDFTSTTTFICEKCGNQLIMD